MTERDPYYVKKGRVDDDGHIRAVESSLVIMHNPIDVFGEKATHNQTVTGEYTYPPPGEDTHDRAQTSGYFHVGEMMELIDSTPPSPADNAILPLLTTGDANIDSRPTGLNLKSNPYLHLPSPLEESPHPLEQHGNIYELDSRTYTHEHDKQPHQLRSLAPRIDMSTIPGSRSVYNTYRTTHLLATLTAASGHVAAPPLVMPPTAFVPPAPNMNYPYRTTDAPISSSGQSLLSLPYGSRVGEPIPFDLQPVINAISRLDKVSNTGHPERRILKKPYDGTYASASPDERLIRDHFASGSGLLKSDSPLRDWYGDLRVFSAKMWEFLAVQKTRMNARR